MSHIVFGWVVRTYTLKAKVGDKTVSRQIDTGAGHEDQRHAPAAGQHAAQTAFLASGSW